MEKNYKTDNLSFQLYKSWEKFFASLTDEQSGRLLKALFAFASGKDIPELDKTEQIVFMLLSDQIDRDGRKWEERCEQNAENIRKRWNKNNTTVKNGKKSYTKNTDKDKDKDKDKEKDKDEDKEKDCKTQDFSKVELTEKERADLVRQSDSLSVERYINNLSQWQQKNRRISKKAYMVIKGWITEDKRTPKQEKPPDRGKTSYDLDAFDEFAKNFDLSKAKPT